MLRSWPTSRPALRPRSRSPLDPQVCSAGRQLMNGSPFWVSLSDLSGNVHATARTTMCRADLAPGAGSNKPHPDSSRLPTGHLSGRRSDGARGGERSKADMQEANARLMAAVLKRLDACVKPGGSVALVAIRASCTRPTSVGADHAVAVTDDDLQSRDFPLDAIIGEDVWAVIVYPQKMLTEISFLLGRSVCQPPVDFEEPGVGLVSIW
jgi:hypothetical protein